MQIRLITYKLTAAHLTEGDTRAVVGVDIGGNLKDKSCKLGLFGLHIALLGLGGAGRWCYLYKAVQQLLYTEVVQSRTEEYWCNLGLAIGLYVELRIYTVYQLQVLAQLGGVLFANALVELFAVYVYLNLISHTLFVGGKQVQFLLVDVVHTLELCSLIDRPAQRTYFDFKFLLQLVEQIERIAAFAVHLIDKDDNWCLTHAAHGHQLSCLSLNTFGSVNHDDSRVNGGKCAEGIFSKVLVTWSIQNVHLIFYVRAFGSIIKLHDRCRHRDTTLFLNVHPVAGGGLFNLVVLYGSSHLYLSAEEQKFLCQRSFTRIRVRYNRKCPSSFYLLIHSEPPKLGGWGSEQAFIRPVKCLY